MKWVLTGLLVYIVWTLGWYWYMGATRPPACRKGHTDFYLTPNGWRCRHCAILAERTRMRRIHKEMHEASSRDRR